MPNREKNVFFISANTFLTIEQKSNNTVRS
jgi:hypothetical protein